MTLIILPPWPASGLRLRRDYDLCLGAYPGANGFAQAIAVDFLDNLLDVLELGRLPLFSFGDEDEMETKLRRHDIAHHARFQGKRHLGKRLHHVAGAWEPAEVAPLIL